MLIVDNFLRDETRRIIQKWEDPADKRRIKELNTLVRDWVRNGVWDKLAVVWLHTAHAHQPSRINLVQPELFTLIDVNGVTFVPNSGISTDGSTTYYRTGWIPNTHGGTKFTLNNASLATYFISALNVGAGIPFGATSEAIRPRNASNLYGARINATGIAASTIVATTSKGLTVGSRNNDAANVLIYKDGSFIESVASASTSLGGVEMYILCQNGAGTPSGFVPTTARIGATIACQGDVNQVLLYTPLQNYMSNTGAI